MTSLDLRNIASAGGNLVVNADKFTSLDLRNIASSGVGTNCKLTIKKAGKLTGLYCRNIASANPGNVTFDFSE